MKVRISALDLLFLAGLLALIVGLVLGAKLVALAGGAAAAGVFLVAVVRLLRRGKKRPE